MMFRDYQLSSKDWSYKRILNIDYFLQTFKNELTPRNIEENLNTLYKYRVDIRSDSYVLHFGNCSLEFEGIDQAVAIINGLERLESI